MADTDTEQDIATGFTLWAQSDDAIRALVNEGLLQIQNSRDVAVARTDVILQAAIAAAEQVQDIRIEQLENPDANYSSFVIEVLVIVAFETTIAGIVLSKVSNALFSHVLATTATAMRRRARALLSSSTAARLRERSKALQILRDLPRLRGPQRGEAVKQLTALATDRSGKARRLIDGFISRSQVPVPVASDSRQALKSFHDAVRTLSKGGGDVNENLQGAAQTGIALLQAPSAGPALSEADSPGVRLLTDIQAYASRVRLSIQLVHNQLEKWMNDQLLEPDNDSYLEILSVCTYRDVRAGNSSDLQRIDDDLNILRNQYRLMFEAVIWAYLFGFQRPRSAREPQRPEIEGENFKNIKERLMDYWLLRFGAQIDARNAEADGSRKFPGKFADLPRRGQVFQLRDHFWLIMEKVRELEGTYSNQPRPVELGTWW
ncbi:hypothetical protein [Steroidobacter sp.]|uniref:hypothetical protein n=1 Tax=Steroidobacter sp. TaxID=1978227 RepID=UPI001A456EAA|nr:hypothetical protein [Steroidobacter sp.]MBL8270921.1 hypothetical protein [Steroidobacter sp.]